MDAITSKLQDVFEQARVAQLDYTPDYCGYYGIECGRILGQSPHASCRTCPLAKFAETGIMHITPEAGKIYRNRSGDRYLCVAGAGCTNESSVAIMKRLTDGWTLKAHDICLLTDGTIAWWYSTEGHWQDG